MANEWGPDESPTRAVALPSEAQPSWRNGRFWALIAAAVAVVVAAVLVVVLVVDKKPASGAEVFLESAGSAGNDPFTPSVAVPQPQTAAPQSPPAAPQSPAPAPSSQSQPPGSAAPMAVRTVSGGEPGLYGGTRNLSSCDTELLINYLGQNPDKGAAWAGVLGIAPTQIRDYVGQLTPVVLRADTRVTNHGFANGKAFALQSVLQAGTAVLVDKFGAPRVRCECGNPLLEPQPVPSAPHYIGQSWPGFGQLTIVITKTVVIINIFILFDWECGCYFGRHPGSPPSDEPPCPEPPPCRSPLDAASAPIRRLCTGAIPAGQTPGVVVPGGQPPGEAPPGGPPPPSTGAPIHIPGKH
jgi:hypothetical protein